jgi:hypothetical protein
LEVFETPAGFAANPSTYRPEGGGQCRLNVALMVHQWRIEKMAAGASATRRQRLPEFAVLRSPSVLAFHNLQWGQGMRRRSGDRFFVGR